MSIGAAGEDQEEHSWWGGGSRRQGPGAGVSCVGQRTPGRLARPRCSEGVGRGGNRVKGELGASLGAL